MWACLWSDSQELTKDRSDTRTMQSDPLICSGETDRRELAPRRSLPVTSTQHCIHVLPDFPVFYAVSAFENSSGKVSKMMDAGVATPALSGHFVDSLVTNLVSHEMPCHCLQFVAQRFSLTPCVELRCGHAFGSLMFLCGQLTAQFRRGVSSL